MEHLENIRLIDENCLDQGLYFQSLFQEACQRQLLGEAKISGLQLELVELLAKQTERFTNGESSSVRVETAQQILKSVTYCIGVYLKSVPDMNRKLELLKEERLQVLFIRGFAKVSSLLKKAGALLEKLKKEALKVDNYAYRDTIFEGLPEFFHDYEPEFSAHENAGSIDYPLCNTIDKLLGIEYQYEYLRRLSLENDFCRKFTEPCIQMLLKSFSGDSEHLLINIFELVLMNALGCIIAGKNFSDLLLHGKDLDWLQKSLKPLNAEELQGTLEKALEELAEALKLDTGTRSYAKEAVREYAFRIRQNLQTGTLGRIWITYPEEEKKAQEEILLEDGDILEDEELRELMGEIEDCDKIADKVAALRRKVHSMNDFAELLEGCFYGGEFDEVFGLLEKSEMDYLRAYLEKDKIAGDSARLYPLSEWQKKLLDFTGKVD